MQPKWYANLLYDTRITESLYNVQGYHNTGAIDLITWDQFGMYKVSIELVVTQI